jgi:hypothetical protein
VSLATEAFARCCAVARDNPSPTPAPDVRLSRSTRNNAIPLCLHIPIVHPLICLRRPLLEHKTAKMARETRSATGNSKPRVVPVIDTAPTIKRKAAPKKAAPKAEAKGAKPTGVTKKKAPKKETPVAKKVRAPGSLPLRRHCHTACPSPVLTEHVHRSRLP